MWPFKTAERQLPACGDNSVKEPASQKECRIPTPVKYTAFAFDTSIGKVYAIEQFPMFTNTRPAKDIDGYITESTLPETVISYINDKGECDEFRAHLSDTQHDEVVRQWLAGWKILQWPRPE